jgi:hypothetical protein
MAISAAQIAAVWQRLAVVAQAIGADVKTTRATIATIAPIPRLQTPPTTPAVGQRWIEVAGGGVEVYDFAWIWAGTEWRSDRLYTIGTGTGRTGGSAAARQDLGGLPPWPGLAGYRLIRGTLRASMEGAGSWTTKIRKYANAATIVDPPWIVGPTIVMAAKGVGIYPIDVPTDSLVPLTICALDLTVTKGNPVADTIFALTTQWSAVRAA